MANEEIRLANIEIVLQTTMKLFLEHGIENTTREMIARASGLSRRSTERYFPTKSACVVEVAAWYGKKLREESLSAQLIDDHTHTAAELLKLFLYEMKQILIDDPRIFACYAEFKAYLYRNSEHRDQDYRRFADAVGSRDVLRKIFETGEKDGTVTAHYGPEANASYLINTILSYFSNVVLLYDTQPELLKQFIDNYITDTWKLYCGG
jgi:AcrR family transcriptional regulator